MDSDEECGGSSEPAHHARRPMNAFLIFCKRHRSVVRERYPTLENRCITKILGEWWAQLEPAEKACYTELAKQYKEAFLRANPDFKWYKLPAPPLRTLVTRPSNQKPPRMECPLATGPIVPGKLADESQMGGLSSLLTSPPHTPTSPCVPKPPKKRYLEETGGPEGCSWEGAETEVKDVFDGVEEKECPGEGESSAGAVAAEASSSGPSTSAAGTRVQASQQQLIERVVDRICGSLSPEPVPAAWGAQEHETNNNETACINEHTVKEGGEADGEEEEAKPNSSEACDGYSEADSALSSREDLTLGLGMLGVGRPDEDEEERGPRAHQTPLTEEAEGRRKSLRACKGKRYQEFMSTGRLATGKRNRGPQPAHEGASTPRKRRHDSGSSTASEKTDSAFSEGSRGSREPDEPSSLQGKNTPTPSDIPTEREPECTPKKQRRLSETSEESFSDSSVRKRFRAADFNLDEKIEALPSLSLEEFQQKKKAKKKRVSCSPCTPRKLQAARDRLEDTLVEMDAPDDATASHKSPLVGSQKRKARRQQITRFDPSSPHANRDTAVVVPAVLNTIGLATLAEVASAKRRLNK